MTYTLAFDVYGTLINTSGVFDSLESLMDIEKANPFMMTWRDKQLEYSFRRGLMDSFVDFSVVTRQALDYCCKKYEINLDSDQKNTLMEVYRVLPAFPDVTDCLDQLSSSGHRLFAFSNGSKKAVTTLLTQAEILDRFEGVVSVEDVGIFQTQSPGICPF